MATDGAIFHEESANVLLQVGILLHHRFVGRRVFHTVLVLEDEYRLFLIVVFCVRHDLVLQRTSNRIYFFERDVEELGDIFNE